jgi:hypothetical protein
MDANTKIKSFEDLVREMRSAQRAYFATRSAIDLQKSKQLERKVDEFLSGQTSIPLIT